MTTNRNDTVNLARGNTLEMLSRASRRNRFFLLRLISVTLIFSLFTLGTLRATLGQESRKDGPDKAQMVTASVTSDGVRIAAPSAVAQLRLKVYDETGQKLFDTKQSGGNLLDWHLQENARERVADGTYLLVVTVQNPGGQRSQKLGLVTVSAQSTTLRSAGVTELSPQQVQALGPIDGEAESLTVVSAENPTPVAVLAHTGDEAQVTRSRGAVTFRFGDFFSARDKEQMRLTEDGRLGIGTDNPKSTLDVAGTIRAERFVLAKPGKPGEANETAAADAAEGVNADPGESLVAGSGSQDRIAKWTDNAGTLGNSGISETAAGLVGIGTTNPTHKLDVQNTGANGAIRSVNETAGVRGLISEQHSTNVVGAVFVGLKSRGTLAAPTAVVPNDFGGFFSNKWYDGTSYVQSGAFGFTVDGPVSQGVVPTRLSFVTSSTSGDGPTAHGVERMTILSGGNVGIGTTSPVAKLDVAGNVNVNGNVTTAGTVQSTSGGFKFPDGSVQSTAATGSKAFTTFAFNSIEIGAPGSFGQVLQLDLPAGTYMVTASLQFENRGLFNKRLVECQIVNEALWFARIEGQGGAMDHVPMTVHTVTQGGTIRVHCGALDGGTGHSNIFLGARRLTAIKLENLVTQ